MGSSTACVLQDSLDLSTIIKAIRTLSGEVRTSALLQKMMKVLFESAGARQGMLIRNIDGRLAIQANGRPDDVSLASELLAEKSADIAPVSIVNHTARTKETPIFENASKDPVRQGAAPN